MIPAFAFLLLAQASSAPASLDPVFKKVPFDQWLAEPNQTAFHWNANVPRAELSFHQRLTTRVEIKLDGRDLETRRAHGSLLLLIQITDHEGTRYQNHGTIELSKVDKNVRASNIEYSQRAFFLPGEYRLAAGILDTGTGEHSTRQVQFRVPDPPHEGFMTNAWRGLPPVEFTGKEDSPENWYRPEVEGRLQWAGTVHAAARIEVILNVEPHRTNSLDLAALIPTVKAISQTGSSFVSERVELLDLARRRKAFDQKDVHEIDWPRLKESLGESNTASIDIHSLAERQHNAQFFVSQVRNVLRDSQQPCVLVVLTPPVAFEPGEDLTPASVEALPACRVVYIRYRAPSEVSHTFHPQFDTHGRSPRMGGPTLGVRPQQIIDQLEATLKPLNPKVLDADTPEQITKAFIEIEKMLH